MELIIVAPAGCTIGELVSNNDAMNSAWFSQLCHCSILKYSKNRINDVRNCFILRKCWITVYYYTITKYLFMHQDTCSQKKFLFVKTMNIIYFDFSLQKLWCNDFSAWSFYSTENIRMYEKNDFRAIDLVWYRKLSHNFQLLNSVYIFYFIKLI